MSWLSLLKAVVGFALALTSYLRERQLIGAGEALAIQKQLEASLDAVQTATRARDAALRDFDQRNGLPDEQDPNLRD